MEKEKIIHCKSYYCWNTSISMIFGKSPKINIVCGNCENGFSKRFKFVKGIKFYAKCPVCNKINYIPIEYNKL